MYTINFRAAAEIIIKKTQRGIANKLTKEVRWNN